MKKTNFSTVLFDFDGLLVNTEQLHFQAYKTLVEGYNCSFDVDFAKFAALAHTSSEAIRQYLYASYPSLSSHPWTTLYAEKQAIVFSLLTKENLEFMPGADAAISFFIEQGKKVCVVTNSPKRFTDAVREHLDLLNTIPHWVTRESYEKPKPNPDGYQTALRLLNSTPSEAVGFEDSLKGIFSLQNASVHPVLICYPDHPQLHDPSLKHVEKYETFIDVLEKITLH